MKFMVIYYKGGTVNGKWFNTLIAGTQQYCETKTPAIELMGYATKIVPYKEVKEWEYTS